MSVNALPGRVRRRLILTPLWRVVCLTLLALGVMALFMTLGSRGNWDFVLFFRGRKVLAMLIVGAAIAASSIVFQTITYNRILTPSIMGFDALYMLIQTLAIFLLGSSQVVQLDPRLRFCAEVLIMLACSGTLYYALFLRAARDLQLLVLVGVVFGVFLSSLTNLMQRVMNPSDFAVLQDAGFASFNAVHAPLLLISTLLSTLLLARLWQLSPVLDVLALGRDAALNLGVPYQRVVMQLLLIVSALVALSTALVGPITFFGLLVANLAYMLAGSFRHRYLLTVAALLAVIVLVAGQMLLESVFSFNSSLSIMIDFAGGLLFLYLLLTGRFR